MIQREGHCGPVNPARRHLVCDAADHLCLYWWRNGVICRIGEHGDQFVQRVTGRAFMTHANMKSITVRNLADVFWIGVSIIAIALAYWIAFS
jgi:hypothetical protein